MAGHTLDESAMKLAAQMKKHSLKISFIDFVKIGGTFAFVQLLLASGYLFLLQKML